MLQRWECSCAADTDGNGVLKGMKNAHRECIFVVSSNPTTVTNTVKLLSRRFIANKRNDFFFPYKMSN